MIFDFVLYIPPGVTCAECLQALAHSLHNAHIQSCDAFALIWSSSRAARLAFAANKSHWVPVVEAGCASMNFLQPVDSPVVTLVVELMC